MKGRKMNTERFKFRVAIKQADGTYKRYNAHRIGWDARGLYAKVAIQKNDKEFLIEDIVIDGENAILEQATGLKDKNGNLIYEGDVIKVVDGCVHLGKTFEVVGCMIRWEMRDLSNDEYDTLMVGCCVEIIGNIHDNEVAE